jgi:hypothetical protein
VAVCMSVEGEGRQTSGRRQSPRAHSCCAAFARMSATRRENAAGSVTWHSRWDLGGRGGGCLGGLGDLYCVAASVWALFMCKQPRMLYCYVRVKEVSRANAIHITHALTADVP